MELQVYILSKNCAFIDESATTSPCQGVAVGVLLLASAVWVGGILCADGEGANLYVGEHPQTDNTNTSTSSKSLFVFFIVSPVLRQSLSVNGYFMYILYHECIALAMLAAKKIHTKGALFFAFSSVMATIGRFLFAVVAKKGAVDVLRAVYADIMALPAR